MLFNTMSMKKEPLGVVPGEALRMFVCGPTVQSLIHVGNARTHVFYDVLARYLAHLGFRVNFLMNITDVDDRITETAKREGVRPSELARQVHEVVPRGHAGLGRAFRDQLRTRLRLHPGDD